MKYAIFADIHSNLEALEAVLKDSKDQAVTHYACAGDIVGYGLNPKECLEIIREMGMPCVKGNHDEYCSAESDLSIFNRIAAEGVDWTRQQLNPEDRAWLRSLPLVCTVAGFTIVHATLDGPQRWGYVFDRLAASASMSRQLTNICFFGHTHDPCAFILDKVVRGGSYTKFTVDRGSKYFINPGAVGQPRDGNPKASYCIYDMEANTIELRRVGYNTPNCGPALAVVR